LLEYEDLSKSQNIEPSTFYNNNNNTFAYPNKQSQQEQLNNNTIPTIPKKQPKLQQVSAINIAVVNSSHTLPHPINNNNTN